MRLPILLTIILIVAGGILDYYVWNTLKRYKYCRIAYLLLAVLMAINVIVAISLPRNNGSDNVLRAVMWMLYTYFTFYIARIAYTVVSAFGYIKRLFGRRNAKPWTIAGAVAALTILAVTWWGALVNRFNLEVEHVDLYYTDLPVSFDGFEIAQFSDFHLGTYGNNNEYINKIVDSINAISPDAVMFTGDIVNRRTSEIIPFISSLSQIKAPYGIYSILGNHDYGDYSKWQSTQAKNQNLQELIELQKTMGWKLLNNETATVHINTDSIKIVGVENWGEPPFTTYGDLDKAYKSHSDSTYKILLTHNPMHWITDIASDTAMRYALTLSGHTHAMQFEVGKWSPSKWRYPTYDGLYSAPDSVRHIYVSRGIGTVGMPARIGATPVITHITLHRIN